MCAAYDRALGACDVIAMPTLPITATPIPPPDTPIELVIQRAHEMFANTAVFDATGHPALTVPCGLSEGLPVGLMLVGRHFDEATIYPRGTRLRAVRRLADALSRRGDGGRPQAMMLYEFSLAPSPRRVRMFIAEKEIEIPSVQINTRECQQFSDEYRAVNPNCVVPTLVLDDGTPIGETVAICRYLEMTHPEPNLMGRDAREMAIIEMWSRQAEFEGYLAAVESVRNAAPMFEGRGLPGVPGGVPQIPALIERGKQTMGRLFPKLDRQLADSCFLAGDRFSIADITAFVSIDFAKRAEIEIPADCANVARWFAEVGKRPSASA